MKTKIYPEVYDPENYGAYASKMKGGRASNLHWAMRNVLDKLGVPYPHKEERNAISDKAHEDFCKMIDNALGPDKDD